MLQQQLRYQLLDALYIRTGGSVQRTKRTLEGSIIEVENESSGGSKAYLDSCVLFGGSFRPVAYSVVCMQVCVVHCSRCNGSRNLPVSGGRVTLYCAGIDPRAAPICLCGVLCTHHTIQDGIK